MFATAVAYSLGKKLEDIRHGLRTFDTSFFQAPGRMNVFNEHPFKVILDYGHNPAAVRAMCNLVERTPVRGRKIAVLTMPGDRRDEDIADVAAIAAGHFGRKPDEVPKLLEAGLLAHGVEPAQITRMDDEPAAVQAALELAQPNDLLLIFGDNITRCWKQIIYFGRDPAAGDPGGPAKAAEPVAPDDLPPLGDFAQMPDGAQLIRDERGVRLARDPEEAD
jgi:cyanophycin synthetase